MKQDKLYLATVCVILLVLAAAGCREKKTKTATQETAGITAAENEAVAKTEILPEGVRKFYRVVHRYDSTYAVYPSCVYLVGDRYLYSSVGSNIMEAMTHKLREVRFSYRTICCITDTMFCFADEQEVIEKLVDTAYIPHFYSGCGMDTLCLKKIDSVIWEFDGERLIEACDLPRAGFHTYSELYGGRFTAMETLPRVFYLAIDYWRNPPEISTDIYLKFLPGRIICTGDEQEMVVKKLQMNTSKQAISVIDKDGNFYTYLEHADDNPYIWESRMEEGDYWIDSADVALFYRDWEKKRLAAGDTLLAKTETGREGVRKFCSLVYRYDSIYAVSSPDVCLFGNRYLYLHVGGQFIMEPRAYKLREVRTLGSTICCITDTLCYCPLYEEDLEKLLDTSYTPGFYTCPADTLYLQRRDSVLWELDGVKLIETCDLPRPGFRTYDELHGGPFTTMDQLPRLFYYVKNPEDLPVIDTTFWVKLLPDQLIYSNGENILGITGYGVNENERIILIYREGESQNYFYRTDENRYIWKDGMDVDGYWIDSTEVTLFYREREK